VSDEKPGIVGWIGQVIYWIGCAIGILSVPSAIWTFFNTGIEYNLESIANGPGLVLAVGMGAWLSGRVVCDLLKGD
jgi:hypothetical protein